MSRSDGLAEAPGELPELDELEQRARPFRALYEHWERNQWSPLDVDYSRDAASFAALEPEARRGLMWIFSHRFHAEFKVATVLAPFLMRAPDYELQVCLATQIADEFRHMQSVLRVYDLVFGIRDHARVKATADANLDPIASALYRALEDAVSPLQHSGDEDDFLKAVLAYHLVAEGVVARTAQNLAVGQYERYGDFPGLLAGQRLVARDEARHIGIGVSYARSRMARDPDGAGAVIAEFVEYFSELTTELLDTALSGDMDSQVLAGYGVEARGFYAEAIRLWNVRLRSIGFLDES
jgi:ribonucleotide reductase beta subunit family protein with ferritin-like domain